MKRPGDLPHGWVSSLGVEFGSCWKAVNHAKTISCRVPGAGKLISRAAAELGITQSCLHNWVRQDLIDRGELVGESTRESVELRRTRRRIRQLELEVEMLTKASESLAEDKPHLPPTYRNPRHSPDLGT